MHIVFGVNSDGTYKVFNTSNRKGSIYDKSRIIDESKDIRNISVEGTKIIGDGFIVDKLKTYKVQIYSVMPRNSHKFRCIDTEGNIMVLPEDRLSALYFKGQALNYRMLDGKLHVISKYVTKETMVDVPVYIHEDYINICKEYMSSGLISQESVVENLNIQGFINRKLAGATINEFIDSHKNLFKILKDSNISCIKKIPTEFIVKRDKGDKSTYKIESTEHSGFFYLIKYEIDNKEFGIAINNKDKRLLKLIMNKDVKQHRLCIEDIVNLVEYDRTNIDSSCASYGTLIDAVNRKGIDSSSILDNLCTGEINKISSGMLTTSNAYYRLRNDILIKNIGIRLLSNKLYNSI